MKVLLVLGVLLGSMNAFAAADNCALYNLKYRTTYRTTTVQNQEYCVDYNGPFDQGTCGDMKVALDNLSKEQQGVQLISNVFLTVDEATMSYNALCSSYPNQQ